MAVVLVLDNVGYHKRHALREVWQALHGAIRALLFTSVPPQLNLIERLWRHLKQRLARHRWWNDVNRLTQATETLLGALEAHFHATDGPTFRPAQNLSQSA